MFEKINILTTENGLKPEKPYCYKDIQYYQDEKNMYIHNEINARNNVCMDTKLYGVIQSGGAMIISKYYCGGFQEKVLDSIT